MKIRFVTYTTSAYVADPPRSTPAYTEVPAVVTREIDADHVDLVAFEAAGINGSGTFRLVGAPRGTPQQPGTWYEEEVKP